MISWIELKYKKKGDTQNILIFPGTLNQIMKSAFQKVIGGGEIRPSSIHKERPTCVGSE